MEELVEVVKVEVVVVESCWICRCTCNLVSQWEQLLGHRPSGHPQYCCSRTTALGLIGRRYASSRLALGATWHNLHFLLFIFLGLGFVFFLFSYCDFVEVQSNALCCDHPLTSLPPASSLLHPPFLLFPSSRGHNQRMEFLGDSIMQLVATEYLFIHFPDHHEGHLTVSLSLVPSHLRSVSLCNHAVVAHGFTHASLLKAVGRRAAAELRYKAASDVVTSPPSPPSPLSWWRYRGDCNSAVLDIYWSVHLFKSFLLPASFFFCFCSFSCLLKAPAMCNSQEWWWWCTSEMDLRAALKSADSTGGRRCHLRVSSVKEATAQQDASSSISLLNLTCFCFSFPSNNDFNGL